MWKNFGNKPNLQSKSTVSLISQEANRELITRKSRKQTNSHTNIVIDEVYSIKNNQNLGYSRAYFQLPCQQRNRAQQNKLQSSEYQKSKEKNSDQEKSIQTKKIEQNNTVFLNKLKIKISSVLKTVKEIKQNQLLIKNDYKDNAVKFKQFMVKIENVVSQKSNDRIEQAFQKIENYKAKLNTFDQRRESILKKYGLFLSELL